MRLTWIQPEDLLPHEFAACRDEGRDVPALEQRWLEAGGSLTPPVSGASETPASPLLRTLALDLLDACDALAPTATTAPAALAREGAVPREAARERAAPHEDAWDEAGPGRSGRMPSLERMHAAWLGRAAGCLLGKPVEKIPRLGIRQILQSSGRWPLNGYFTAQGLPREIAERWPWNRRSAPNSLAENIDGMPEDDDLNFPLLALRILSAHGRGFTSADVAQAWLDWLPAGRVFTAERVAYRNLLLGMTPPDTARRHNPFREWIGAQIRADVYGWINPGRPSAAAEMVARDAAVSHTGDGILGARWVAAMTATAVTASNVDEVLDAGLETLPPGRFRDAVTGARRLRGDWEGVVDELYRKHGHLHWVHVRNNAALIAAALAHGRGDFAKSICAVVSGGWDTDSNGATVGSITGALNGEIPPQWTGPLHDTLHSSLAGFDGVKFAELAAWTLRLAS